MVKRSLSADSLFTLVRGGFEGISDWRAKNVSISLSDALMSGFAMFSLKDPSLLAFDERRRTDSNLRSIYGIEKAPGDTQMRTILDDVEAVEIRPVFKRVHRHLEQSRELRKFKFLGGSYLVSLDGTGYFCSKKVHCDACLEKVNKKTCLTPGRRVKGRITTNCWGGNHSPESSGSHSVDARADCEAG